MSENDPAPEQNQERLKDFIAECILLFEREGEQALEQRLLAEPELAERAKQRIAALRESGLLADPHPDPEQIGSYRVLRRIGAGGMGTVLLAEQQGELHRRVAIKVIRPGLDSREVLARFALERQALAMLDHQNIAKVLDAGETPQGRPFMVMEYVAGVPITDYCDDRRLSITERVQLFCIVCDAVQHAHHKGILHRDLKPSNILVVDRDGRPWPVIIDFGVAKSVGGRLTDETLVTVHGRMLGTPEYMSPEQAANDIDMDTRADVFSLGVVLFELLTGTLPIDSKQLRRAEAGEMLRMLRDSPTPAPSRRITTLAGVAGPAATRQLTDAGRLSRALRGDLDWITLRALERDRNRRYGMPGELAADLRRHLANEPVLAGAPSSIYRVRKFVARNLLQVTAAAIVFSSLVLALGFSLSAYNRVTASARQSDADFEQAMQSIERLTFFADERLAKEPHMDDVRHQMLTDALQFYEQIAAGRTDTRTFELRVAKAHSRVARILSLLGNETSALAAADNARARFDALAAAGELEDDAMTALAGVDLERARALNVLGRADEAEQALQTAAARNRSIARTGRALSAAHLRMHVQCLGMLAKVVQRRDPRAACEALAEAARLSKPWFDDETASDEQLATALLLSTQHAVALAALGELEAARKLVAPLLERLDRVLLGRTEEQQERFVETSLELGQLLQRMGMLEDGARVLSRAADQGRWFTAAHPVQTTPLRRLGLTLHALADIQLARHELADAAGTQAECVQAFETLAEKSPAASHHFLLGMGLLNYARILAAPRHYGGKVDPDSTVALARGIEVLRALPAEQRNGRQVRMALANALAQRGINRQQLDGDAKAAIEDLQQSVDELRQLCEDAPELVDVRRLWLQNLVELMRLCATHGEDQRTLALADEVEREAPAVRAAFPDSIDENWPSSATLRARMPAHARLGHADELLHEVRRPSHVEHDWTGHQRRIDALLLLLDTWPAHEQRETVIAEARRLADQAVDFAAQLAQTETMRAFMRARIEELRVRVERAAGDLDAACAAAATAVAGHAMKFAASANQRNHDRLAVAVDAWLQLLWDRGDDGALLAGIDTSSQAFAEHADRLWLLASWCARLAERCGEQDGQGAARAQQRGINLLHSWRSLPGTHAGLLATAPTLAPLRRHPSFDELLSGPGK